MRVINVMVSISYRIMPLWGVGSEVERNALLALPRAFPVRCGSPME
jgi:hypothetical protein